MGLVLILSSCVNDAPAGTRDSSPASPAVPTTSPVPEVVGGSVSAPMPAEPAPPPEPPFGRACGSISGEALLEDGPSVQTTLLQEGGEGRPEVEAAIYPRPDYEGEPWSQWGQGVVLPGGRFVSAIGDHRGQDGNSYLYEYSPGSHTLTLITDILSLTGHESGAWGYGKIHGQMVAGPCSDVYFSTYWGDRDGLVYGPSYQGDLLFRLDLDGRLIANLGVPVPQRGIPSLAGWPEGRLLYGEATDPHTDPDRGAFFVFDMHEQQVIYRNDDPNHVGFRSMAVDAAGRALYSLGGGALALYDPGTNEVDTLPHLMPGAWLRAATAPGPDGTVYGATRDPDVLFAMTPSGEIRTLGPIRGYTTSIALHPSGDQLFYVPGAHGDSWVQGTPLISVDTRTGEETIVVELNDLGEQYLDLRLGGSYNVAIDPSGGVVYVGANAGIVGTDSSFGEVVLLVVNLP
jgi:hypothetical protein